MTERPATGRPATGGSPAGRPARRRVLILCTGNAARSQMAEGLLRALGGDRVDVVSAGTHPAGLHPLAVRAMAEGGIDIRHHRSKSVDEFREQAFDDVITVCDAAAELCPVFPGPARRVHWSTPDPSFAAGTEEERLEAFRRVRNGLEAHLREWLETSAR